MSCSIQNLDDYEFDVLLKELDELEETDCLIKNIKLGKAAVMSTPQDTEVDNNFSDFDNSDEDIASLLADDEDDIFAKKTFPKSPSKKVGSEKLSDQSKKSADATQSRRKNSTADNLKNSATKTNSAKSDESKYLDDLGFNQLSNETISPKSNAGNRLTSKSSDDKHSGNNSDDDDVLKSLESKDKPSSPKRRGSFFDDFLKTLSPKKPSKSSAALHSVDEKLADDASKDDDSDDDILKSLGSNDKSTASSRKKSESYFDDLLKNVSPKQSPKKTSLKKEKSLEDDLDTNLALKSKTERENSDDEEDDFFNKFLSSDSKKSKLPVQKHSTPENKRETFQKQVSFKDTPISSPERPSPVKAKPLKSTKQQPDPIVSDLKTKTSTQPRRSERLGASNKDDTDWLNFFKESPKKNKPSTNEEKENSFTKTSSEFKTGASRRRSSNAEWLGLNESKMEDKIESRSIKDAPDSSLDWMGAGEPMIKPRPKSSLEPQTKSRVLNRPQTSNLDFLSNTTTKSKPEQDKDSAVSVELVKNPSKIPKTDSEGSKMFCDNDDATGFQNITKTSDAHSLLLSNMGITSSIQNSGNLQNRGKISDPGVALKTTAQAKEGILNSRPSTQASVPESDGSVYVLQTMINNHLIERNQLVNSIESMKVMYEERIMTMENLHRNQLKALEESLKSLETKHKTEMERMSKDFEEKLKIVQNEKTKYENDLKYKLEEIEVEHTKEVQRLKELQSQSIAHMKQDHEEALSRLKRLKEQEIEAVLSTQTHSRSLHQLTEQLEARATELASLQAKVEEKNKGVLREKQALLDAKEQDLKSLQNRLQKQLEVGDDERTRLQQLVLQLESRLHKYTTEGEEDRWDVQQLKSKLLVQQKYLDEEHKLNMQQVEKEKEKLRLSQDSLLHEQKTVLLQLAQERQYLMQEKIELESLSKKVKEDETRFNVKRLKEEAFIERQKNVLQQEESRLQFEKSNLKQESEFLEQERDSFQREKKIFFEERAKLNELSFKLKQKESEIAAKEMWTIEERERSKVEHSVAQKMKIEHQTKMQQITQKMQELMEKEHQILAEKENLTTQRIDLDNKKNSTLCNKCKISLGFPVSAPPQGNTNITPMNPMNNTPVLEYQLPNLISNHIALPRQDPSLVVWYLTAQRDREYLQEELSFLKSLKDSYKK